MYKLSLELPAGIFDFAKFKQDYPDTEIKIYDDQLPVVTFTTVIIPTTPRWEGANDPSRSIEILTKLLPDCITAIKEIENSTSYKEYLAKLKDVNKDYNTWLVATTEITRKYEGIVESYCLQ